MVAARHWRCNSRTENGFGKPGSLLETSGPDGTAFLNKHQDRFFMFAETGDLVIGKFAPDGFTEIDRASLLKPTNKAFGRPVVWSAPAFANKCIYVRNDEECICVSLSR